MSTMILEPDTTSLDVRGLKLMNAQISIGAKMASTECFSMPIVVDGEVTNVTMKIVRNKQQKGLVNITLDSGSFGRIAAQLRAKQKDDRYSECKKGSIYRSTGRSCRRTDGSECCYEQWP